MASKSVHQYATFYVGDLFFGIEVHQVQELLRHQEITRVPLAPDVIKGLINLRGQIVTAVDMRRRLGLPPRESAEPPMNVVLRYRDGIVSLIVDEIGDVLEPEAESSEPPPVTLRAAERAIIERVYKLDGKLLLALSTSHLLEGLCSSAVQTGGEL
ncbi:MAG: chemotaxis protein CheW [Bryobacteraceae bacterium]|nr:chemotaxis protein CheW [Bryobacteraceae bacterium]